MRVLLLLPVLALFSGCEREAFEVVRRPLEMAAERGDLDEINRLIGAGADIDGDDGTFNPLTQAVVYRVHVDVVRALLDAGANPDGRERGASWCLAIPLSSALQAELIETSRLLLESGATFVRECSDPMLGFLPPASIELLVEYGLDPQAVDKQGRNALHRLLGEPRVALMPPQEGIQYLIRIGVPLNAADDEGKTPLAYWQEPRAYEMFDLRNWLWSAIFGEPSYVKKAREQRTEITAMLSAAGATL